jgi:hypothetical protein
MENKKSGREADNLPESEADARFDQAIRNALATKPKPHKPKRAEDSHNR